MNSSRIKFQRHFNLIVKTIVKAAMFKFSKERETLFEIIKFVFSFRTNLICFLGFLFCKMTQNILRPQKAFIRHWMCTDAKKRKKERGNENGKARRSWCEKLGRKEESRRERRNEILANAFVFAMWLHRDVTMEVIGIPRMSQCNNSICAHAAAYIHTHCYTCV